MILVLLIISFEVMANFIWLITCPTSVSITVFFSIIKVTFPGSRIEKIPYGSWCPQKILDSSAYYGLSEEVIVLFMKGMAARNLKHWSGLHIFFTLLLLTSGVLTKPGSLVSRSLLMEICQTREAAWNGDLTNLYVNCLWLFFLTARKVLFFSNLLLLRNLAHKL